MKLKSMLSLSMLAVSAFFLNGCSDDESPTLRFKGADGEIITLKGANLYLMDEEDNDDLIYRDYFISDGELTGTESGWYLENYSGGTYFLAIELAVPIENDFAPGDYPQRSSLEEAEAGSNTSYIRLKREDGSKYSSLDNLAPVKVSGGFDDGDKMTIKFKGKLIYDPVSGSEEEVTTEFYYSGRVQDVRPF